MTRAPALFPVLSLDAWRADGPLHGEEPSDAVHVLRDDDAAFYAACAAHLDKEAVAAAIKYLIYSVFGASAALLGIFFVAANAPSFDFSAGGLFAPGAPVTRSWRWASSL